MLTKEELQEIKELIYRFGCREFSQDYRDQKLINDCDRLEQRLQEHIEETFKE